MDTRLDQLKADLAALPRSDRAELIEHLIRSLDDQWDEDAVAAWASEIERRVRQISSGQAESRPADEVFAAMRAKYPIL